MRLWRPDAEEAQTYSIVDQTTEVGLDVSFVETESLRALDPEVIQLMEGVQYAILAPAKDEENGERPAVNVRFVTLDPDGDYSRPARLAAALHESGCTSQLGVLANAMKATVNQD